MGFNVKRCFFGVPFLCFVYSLFLLWKCHQKGAFAGTLSIAQSYHLKGSVENPLSEIQEDPLSILPSANTHPTSTLAATLSPSPTPADDYALRELIRDFGKPPVDVRYITGPSPSSSATPSPSPFGILIPKSLHGTRQKTSHSFLDTIINTPLYILLTDLIGDWVIGHDILLNYTSPQHGNITVIRNNTCLVFHPEFWYTGYDQFTVSAQGRDVNDRLITRHETVRLRIKVGVLLTKSLVKVPDSYHFAEIIPDEEPHLKRILKNIDAALPVEDHFTQARYKSCAVVGNGGSLKGRKKGSEIDSHDYVVRINDAPLANYIEDVGSKVNLAVRNAPMAGSCWGLASEHPGYQVLAQAVWPYQFESLHNCTQGSQRPILPLSYLFADLVDRILNHYHQVLFNTTERKYRSTGMIAVTAMATMCEHVSLYGFERGRNMEMHYFPGNETREWNGHSYPAEKAFYEDLARGKGLFEPFLELYDLFTSFSYIVD